MKTDKELLELAAKAAGYKLKNEIHNADDELIGFRTNARPLAGPWNPLTDDGDALRLAVRLDMRVSVISASQETFVIFKGGVCEEAHGGDAFAATRRSIVRAAAAIGEAMP